MTELEKKGREIIVEMLRNEDMPLMMIMGALNKCAETFGTDQEKRVAIAVDHVVAIMFPIGKR